MRRHNMEVVIFFLCAIKPHLIASVMLYVFSLDKINGWMDG